MKGKPPRYELDAATRELVEQALEWAQSTSHTQLDDDAAAYINDTVLELARRFGITVRVEPRSTGEVVRIKPQPKFTVIDGRKDLEPEPENDK